MRYFATFVTDNSNVLQRLGQVCADKKVGGFFFSILHTIQCNSMDAFKERMSQSVRDVLVVHFTLICSHSEKSVTLCTHCNRVTIRTLQLLKELIIP